MTIAFAALLRIKTIKKIRYIRTLEKWVRYLVCENDGTADKFAREMNKFLKIVETHIAI